MLAAAGVFVSSCLHASRSSWSLRAFVLQGLRAPGASRLRNRVIEEDTNL